LVGLTSKMAKIWGFCPSFIQGAPINQNSTEEGHHVEKFRECRLNNVKKSASEKTFAKHNGLSL